MLSWQLYRDDPAAAQLVSASLNRGHDLGLRQSEIEALKILAGQMPSIQGTAVAESFVFDELTNRARLYLDAITDETDFPELAGFVATMGGNSAPWVAEYVRFANIFVISSERRLRLAAFTVVNKMPCQTPRAKLAVIFRAYRLKPQRGLCPIPEHAFADPGNAMDVGLLEELLYYWWKTCSDVLDRMPGNEGQVLRTNVSIRAAEALSRHWLRTGAKHDNEPLTKKLLAATLDFANELPEKPTSRTQGKWVDYSSVEEQPKKQENATPPMILPKVIAYDSDGVPLSTQEQRTAEEMDGFHVDPTAVAEVPFRQWLATDLAKGIDVDACYQGAVHQVLHSLHLSVAALAKSVRVIYNP